MCERCLTCSSHCPTLAEVAPDSPCVIAEGWVAISSLLGLSDTPQRKWGVCFTILLNLSPASLS
jgi:hypothetical protein